MSHDLEFDKLLAPLLSHASDTLMLGGVLLKNKIGEGAAGNVYSGLHTRLNIPVAVKVLKDPSSDTLPCFLREARLTVSIEHPNLVRVYDVNCDEATGLHYMVMEFVEGCSAYQMLERSMAQRNRSLSLTSALEIIMAASSAMAMVHSHGVVHRDLKPDNMLIRSRDGVVKVADLGLASTHAGSAKQIQQHMVGTMGFLSPEVVVGRTAMAASDVYALGASFYELLTGSIPYGNETETRYYELQLEREPRDPRELLPDLDEEIANIILKCLRRNPLERYTDAGFLVKDLEKFHAKLSSEHHVGTEADVTDLHSPLVMIVDDEVPILELMKDALEFSGFRTVCFGSSVEALNKVDSLNPDVAVLDRRMPELDGISLCRLIRQKANFEDLPVLMLSGDGEENIISQAMRGGIDDYLLKPANIADIIMRVRLLSKMREANRHRKQLENQWQNIKRASSKASDSMAPKCLASLEE
jgi:serine/threonine protein kinase